jgi:MurNAc alpha-1-phosphate uridylyltransferase
MTRAILLSAGRGERMRPLTDTIPKPLILINNKPLIFYHLEKLASIGIKNVVINISHLADKIRETVGDGKKFNLNIIYSYEPEALETAGGILKALPLLGNEPFLVISSDIYTDYPYENLLSGYQHEERAARQRISLDGSVLAHLLLAPNPDYHPEGDFSIDKNGLLTNTPQYTFANIGLYNPDLFKNCTPGKSPLGPLLRKAIERHLISGELYNGVWYNVGTLDELKKIEKNPARTA